MAKKQKDPIMQQVESGMPSGSGSGTDFAGGLSDLWGGLTGQTAAQAQLDAANAAAQAQLQQAREAQQFLVDQARLGRQYISGGVSDAQGFMKSGTEKAAGYQDQALANILGSLNRGNTQASGILTDLYTGGLGRNFEADPGYQFRLQQGEDAINRMAAAQGGRHGGETLKALAEYNQNFASNEFDQYAQRQMGLGSSLANLYAGQGQQLANAYSGYGSNMANMYNAQGNNLANLYSQAGTNMANLGIGAAGQNSQLSQAMMGAIAGPVQYAGGPQQAQSNFLGGLASMAAGKALGSLFG